MKTTTSLALRFALVLAAASTSVACSDTSDTASGAASNESGGPNAGAPGQGKSGGSSQGSNGAAERAVAEADIVQLADGRLYALSRSGTLSIVDVSKPGQLAMLGQAYLPGQPFEMYRRGDLLVVMTNGAYSVTGQESTATRASPTAAPPDANGSAGVIVINVADPGLMQRVGTFAVPGEIADSRVVGDILYLVTYENASCYRCGQTAGTMVTSFNLASAATLDQIDHVAFPGDAMWDASWGEASYKRSVFATNERLYVGGHAEQPSWSGTGTKEGVIDVLDITDPRGKINRGAHLETAGAITSRWQMDESNGVFRVVSQRGAGYTTAGIGSPEVETFHIWNPRSMQPMGKTNLKLPRQEQLKTVRFDGDRAYAITFVQTDPLFIIDLASEAAPKQRGELEMPGWMFHLEPHGNRLLGLGVDSRTSEGGLNVSLFDVADMDHPKMLERVSFGPAYASEDTLLAEDQDRIQKAFRVLSNGLVVVPFSGTQSYTTSGARPGSAACPSGGGVQLIEWVQDDLTKRALLPVAGNPRRALEDQGQLLAVSDSNVTAFDLGRKDVALRTADLVIGECEPRTSTPAGWRGSDVMTAEDDWGHDHYGHCSTAGAGAGARGSLWAGLGLGLAALVGAVRRRRQA